jgi:hypothetical protein
MGAALGIWSVALVTLTLLQMRFDRVLAPLLCVAVALALAAAAGPLSRLLEARPAGWARGPVLARWLPVPLVLALVVADPAMRELLVPVPAREQSALESTSLYLKDQQDPRPDAPGVLASWDRGHPLLRLSGRPVLTAGFGPWTGRQSFAEAEGFMKLDGSGLEALMERRKVSWVVTGMAAAFPARSDRGPDANKPFYWNASTQRVAWSSIYFKARPVTPLILGGGGDPQRGLPHVATLRPRFASPHGAIGLGFPMPRLWLYERVPGAHLVGDAEPGALVEAVVPLRIRGELAPYIAWSRADSIGHFVLVVPLPNGVDDGGIATGQRTVLRIDGREVAQVAITPAQVSAGAALPVAVGGRIVSRLSRSEARR